MELFKCGACDNMLSSELFRFKKSGNKVYKETICRKCRNHREKLRRIANKDEVNEAQRKYMAEYRKTEAFIKSQEKLKNSPKYKNYIKDYQKKYSKKKAYSFNILKWSARKLGITLCGCCIRKMEEQVAKEKANG